MLVAGCRLRARLLGASDRAVFPTSQRVFRPLGVHCVAYSGCLHSAVCREQCWFPVSAGLAPRVGGMDGVWVAPVKASYGVWCPEWPGGRAGGVLLPAVCRWKFVCCVVCVPDVVQGARGSSVLVARSSFHWCDFHSRARCSSREQHGEHGHHSTYHHVVEKVL